MTSYTAVWGETGHDGKEEAVVSLSDVMGRLDYDGEVEAVVRLSDVMGRLFECYIMQIMLPVCK